MFRNTSFISYLISSSLVLPHLSSQNTELKEKLAQITNTGWRTGISGPSCVIQNPTAPFPALGHPQESVNCSENTWKVQKIHMSSLWIKSSATFLQMDQSPKQTIVCETSTMTLGQELWKRPLNHFKATAEDKARPPLGLCQRGYLICSLNCLKKTCTCTGPRLIQTTLEDWITVNYCHEHCAIQTNRIHILNSRIPQVHHVSQLWHTSDPPFIQSLSVGYSSQTPFTPSHLKCLQSNS